MDMGAFEHGGILMAILIEKISEDDDKKCK
jgi:hypothetical protein